MLKNRKSHSLIGFYLLLTYVLLQFAWWSYLMFDLNTELIRLKTEVVVLKANSPEETEKEGRMLQELLNKKRMMVIGEGSVFLALLLLGAIRVRGIVQKETQLAQQQSNFLLSVTHELKSPIASVRLQLETLLLREIDREKEKEILKAAISDTDRLNALVENILLATKIDKSNFVLHKEETDVSAYIEKLLAQGGVAPGHQLRSIVEPGIRFPIDKINFASIVLNLLDNACKYSPKGTDISLEFKKTAEGAVLEVSDQGSGIREEEKKRVFDKFYRSGNESTRSAKGTGLGLYIVKHLVEEHGGKISVSDNSPTGTIMEIYFKFLNSKF
jgi:two-component system phosphate regulon sensor histidine kinase PhoR